MRFFFSYSLLILMCSFTSGAEFQARRESSPINEFSINLLKSQVEIVCENTTLSSLSTANTLAILHAISDSCTKKQIEKILPHPEKVLPIIPNIKSRQPSGKAFYKQPEFAWSFRSAEAIFSNRFNEVDKLTKDHQNSFSLIKLDFSSSGKANHIINKWVNDQTEFQIKDFVQGNEIPNHTSLLIVNAVSLKGTWTYPFNPKFTHQEKFHTPEKTVLVPMMFHERINVACHQEESGLTSIGLAYGSPKLGNKTLPELALIIIMPGKGTTLKEFIKNSSIDSLGSQMPREIKDVELEFPRFKSSGRTRSLIPALKNMGITRIFSHEKETEGKICAAAPMKADNILHQCFLSISETGTEPLPDPGIHSVRARHDELSIDSSLPRIEINRPFMWFIYDLRNRCIVFIGAQFSPMPN